MVKVPEGITKDTEKYQDLRHAVEKIELLARELRKSMNRAEKLEDAILKYVSEADRAGTMNPKNLKILHEAVIRRSQK